MHKKDIIRLTKWLNNDKIDIDISIPVLPNEPRHEISNNLNFDKYILGRVSAVSF